MSFPPSISPLTLSYCACAAYYILPWHKTSVHERHFKKSASDSLLLVMIAFLNFINTTVSLLCVYVQLMLKLTFSSCNITCLPPEAICQILLQMGSLLKITSLGLLLTNIFRLGPHLSTFKARDTVFKILPHIRRCGRITFKLIILLIGSMQSLKSWFSTWFFLSVSTLIHYCLMLLWTEHAFVIS